MLETIFCDKKGNKLEINKKVNVYIYKSGYGKTSLNSS